MTTLAAFQSLIAQGESVMLELKRSTAELKRGGETPRAFLIGEGGKVLIRVGPDGRPVGQEGADITLRDIAAMLGRFEPPARGEEILRTRQTAIEQRRLSAGTSMDVGDILDNKQQHVHAFAMVREAIAWLDRTLPRSARFSRGSILREDRSIPRNPLIAGAFHRTGAIEAWGRGTNRVIEACRAVRHRGTDVQRGLGRRRSDLPGGRRHRLGTQRVPSRSYVRPKCGPSSRAALANAKKA